MRAAAMATHEAAVHRHLAQLELTHAAAVAAQMVALAGQARSASAQALALATLAHVQTRQERLPEAVATAALALAAAPRSRDRGLVALALLRAATAGWQSGPEAAAAQAEEAAQLFEARGDSALQGQALRVLGAVRLSQADTPAHRAIVERVVALARASGDRGGESRALNGLYSNDPDLAQRVRGLNQALRVAREGGDQQQERATLHNLALTYAQLGLLPRALRLIRQVLALHRAHSTPLSLLNPLTIAIRLLSLLDRRAEAEALAAEGEAAMAAAAGTAPAWQIDRARFLIAYRMARWQSPTAALKAVQAVVALDAAHPPFAGALPLMQALAADAALAAGEPVAALRNAEAAAAQQRQGRTVGGSASVAHIHWQHARALAANGRRAEAGRVCERAYAELVDTTAALSDEGLRRSALHAPGSHAALLSSWVAQARAAALPAARWTAHLQGTMRLEESVGRMVATGLRLNEAGSSAALHEVLIEEVAELLGARRVLLLRADSQVRKTPARPWPSPAAAC